MASEERRNNMEIMEVKRFLSLLGIPQKANADDMHDILARLVAAGSLSFGELQTARDIVNRTKCANNAAYLFLAAMFISQKGGNAFLRPEKGVSLLLAGGHLEETMEGAISDEKYAEKVNQAWQDAVAAAESVKGDVVIKVEKNDRTDDIRWFFQRNLSAVKTVSETIATLAQRADGDKPLSETELGAATGFKGFELNDQQKEAVRKVAQNRFVIVTGGPGTGKTTVVCAMLRALMARGLDVDEIALAAPTGRAAQRMGEALRNQCAAAKDLKPEIKKNIESLEGSTIHSLLGGYPPEWKYKADNRLPLKLVVVDESSMVDIHLMAALLAALPSTCRLVLLGDKDQLPSVETGALLGDIVGGKDAPVVVRLTESKRFTKAFAESAQSINSGDSVKFNASAAALSTDGKWLNTFDSPDAENKCFRCLLPKDAKPSLCHERLLDWATHYGLLNEKGLVELASDTQLKDDEALTEGKYSPKAKAIFDELDRSRILTVVRKGPYGVHGVNELLVKARFGGRLPFNPLVKAGVPVIITRNTPSKKLWNGDVGVTVHGKSGMVVMFPRGDKVVCCPVGLLPEHELAYAITVHKSQGTEFGNVLVVLPNNKDHPLLNRQLVYTGITRAKKRAVILGTKDALNHAIETKVERDTGIALDVTT